MHRHVRFFVLVGFLLLATTAAEAQIDARLLRQPDVSSTEIAFVYGCRLTVPTFSFYNTDGEWAVENHGVDPDIEVVDDPSLMINDGDPQLDRAIAEVLEALEKNPPTRPERPAYPVR